MCRRRTENSDIFSDLARMRDIAARNAEYNNKLFYDAAQSGTLTTCIIVNNIQGDEEMRYNKNNTTEMNCTSHTNLPCIRS